MDTAKIIENLVSTLPQLAVLLLWNIDLRREKATLQKKNEDLVEKLIEK